MEVQEIVSAVINTVVDRSVEVEAESTSSRTQQVEKNSKCLPTITDLSVPDTLVSPLEFKKEGENSEKSNFSENDEEALLTSEQEQLYFKTPQKIKMKSKSLDAKMSKTAKLQNENTQDTDTDSDSSESSLSFFAR